MTTELEIELSEGNEEIELEVAEMMSGPGGVAGSLIWTAASQPIYNASLRCYQTPISNLSGRTGASPMVGDLVFNGSNYYPITTVDSSQSVVYMSDPVSIQGQPGRDGATGATGATGADGATFTPSVSSAGVISWTNDGNKQNPASVDLVSAVINALPVWQGGSY